MPKITIKTPQEVEIMKIGGQKLGDIRKATAEFLKPGMTTAEVDRFADNLINQSGGKASFKMVSGYHHATCININDEVVHGIPGKTVIKDGDIVGIDVGLFYQGFHTDAAVTVRAGGNKGEWEDKFLETGKLGLKRAIEAARVGRTITDLSKAMQQTVEKAGFSAVRALTGHGVGRELHEEPAIPCFVMDDEVNSPVLKEGMVIAIEIMYNAGTFEVVYKNDDGWTIATADGKISGLFEESVAVTKNGPVVLTAVR
jgi:methionyl aminopeptidase